MEAHSYTCIHYVLSASSHVYERSCPSVSWLVIWLVGQSVKQTFFFFIPFFNHSFVHSKRFFTNSQVVRSSCWPWFGLVANLFLRFGLSSSCFSPPFGSCPIADDNIKRTWRRLWIQYRRCWRNDGLYLVLLIDFIRVILRYYLGNYSLFSKELHFTIQ